MGNRSARTLNKVRLQMAGRRPDGADCIIQQG